MTLAIRARAGAVASIVLLGAGCSSIGERLDESMRQAEQLNERCEAAADAFPIPVSSKDFIGELADRLKLRLASLCPAGKAGGMCDLPHLDDQLKEVRGEFQDADQTIRDQLEAKLKELDVKAQNVRTRRDEVRGSVEALIKSALPNSHDVERLTEDCKNSRQWCASELLRLFRAQRTQLETLKASLEGLAVQIHAFQDAVEDAAAALKVKDDATAAAIKRVMAAVRGYAWGASSAADAGLDAWQTIAGGGVEQMVEQYLAAKLSFKAADATLDMLERAVSRFDHMMDKIDDKTYAMSAFIVWWWEGDIQDQLDRFYVKQVRERFKNRATVLAFARAACERLSAPPMEGARSSLVMPFLLQAFANIKVEEMHRDKCMTESGTDADCSARAKDMVVDGANATLTEAAKRTRDDRLTGGTPSGEQEAQQKVAGWLRAVEADPALVKGNWTASAAAAAARRITPDVAMLSHTLRPTQSPQIAGERLHLRQAMMLEAKLAELQGLVPTDLQAYAVRISAEWHARTMLAQAGLPASEQAVRKMRDEAAGDAIYTFHERCAVAACTDPGVKDAVSAGAANMARSAVNLRVQAIPVITVSPRLPRPN